MSYALPEQYSSLHNVAVGLDVTESLEQEIASESFQKDRYILVQSQLVPAADTSPQRNPRRLAELRSAIHNELVARDVGGIQLREEVYVVLFSGLARDTAALAWESLIYAGALSGSDADSWVTGDVFSVYYVDYAQLCVSTARPSTGQRLQPPQGF